jgi:NOL1/NOP2/sun family putative RNA methylase
MKYQPIVDKDFPKAFLDRMAGLLGSEFNEFLSCLRLPATTGLRVNTLKITSNEFIHKSSLMLSPLPWCSSGFIVCAGEGGTVQVSHGTHPYHSAGLYYLQEPSAMAAAETLAPHHGEKVLDLAAAPGGKATHLAALMNNTGLLVANEIHPKRVWDLIENLERCGVTNAVVVNETPQRLADHFGEYFDRVMLDVPCSGEGMFRKSEVARKEWKPELIRSCAIRQSSILEQAARMVKPGGHIAYTTCTYSPEENEGVIDRFLLQHPEFNLEVFPYIPGYQPAKPEWIGLPAEDRVNHAVRIWPHRTQGEGHFIALLIKHESSAKYLGNDQNKASLDINRHSRIKGLGKVKSILDDFYRANLTNTFERSKLAIDGSYIYYLTEDTPNLTGLHAIRPGWWLGSFNKERFTPSHSLAMGIKSDQAKHTLPLTPGDRQLSAYFMGESFPNAGEDGWVLVCVDDYPVGWGKRIQNVIKNFYPHGLRRLTRSRFTV